MLSPFVPLFLALLVALVDAQTQESVHLDVLDLHSVIYGFGTPEPMGTQRYWVENQEILIDLSKVEFPRNHLWEVDIHSDMITTQGSCQYSIGYVSTQTGKQAVRSGALAFGVEQTPNSFQGEASAFLFLRGTEFPGPTEDRSHVTHIFINVDQCYLSRYVVRNQFNAWNGAVYAIDISYAPIDGVNRLLDLNLGDRVFFQNAENVQLDEPFLSLDNTIRKKEASWTRSDFALDLTEFWNMNVSLTLDIMYYANMGSSGTQINARLCKADICAQRSDFENAAFSKWPTIPSDQNAFGTYIQQYYDLALYQKLLLPDIAKPYVFMDANGEVGIPPFVKLWKTGVEVSSPHLITFFRHDIVDAPCLTFSISPLIVCEDAVEDPGLHFSFSLPEGISVLSNPFFIFRHANYYVPFPRHDGGVLVTTEGGRVLYEQRSYNYKFDDGEGEATSFGHASLQTQIGFNAEHLQEHTKITVKPNGDVLTFVPAMPFYSGSQDYCSSSPCAAGTCYNHYFSFFCLCPPGITGTTCEEAIADECSFTSCLNGGTCHDNLAATGYTCECPEEWAGDRCEHAADNCPVKGQDGSSICLHGGHCVTGSGNSFKCDCSMTDFVGPFCELARSACTLSPTICGAGKCIPSATDSQTFECDCTDTGMAGHVCDVPVACMPNPCMHSGHCVAGDAGVAECICPTGYMGDHCQMMKKEIFHDCRYNGVGCGAKGMCMANSEGDYRCSCNAYWAGDACDTHVVCLTNPCQNEGECSVDPSLPDNKQKAHCVCTGNWFGDLCQESLRDYFDDCTFSHKACMHGGKCAIVSKEGVADKFTCVGCNRGWTGDFCESAVVCAHANGGCMNGASCTRGSDGLASCQCSGDWVGPTCEMSLSHYIEVRLEALTTGNCRFSHLRCENSGECVVKGDGSYACVCTDTAYTGPMCETPKVCQPNPCMNGGMCAMADDGTHMCHCPGTHVGKSCELPLANFFKFDCHLQPCQNGGHCSDDGKCVCDTSTWVGDWCETHVACTDMDCNGGKCFVHDGAAMCHCPGSLFGDHCQHKLEFGLADCRSKSCLHGGVCQEFGMSGKYVCHCDGGWTGDHCEISPPCSPNPCANEGRCIPVGDAYGCLCTGLWSGDHCTDDVAHVFDSAQMAALALVKPHVETLLVSALSDGSVAPHVLTNAKSVTSLETQLEAILAHLNSVFEKTEDAETSITGVSTIFTTRDEAKETADLLLQLLIRQNATLGHDLLPSNREGTALYDFWRNRYPDVFRLFGRESESDE